MWDRVKFLPGSDLTPLLLPPGPLLPPSLSIYLYLFLPSPFGHLFGSLQRQRVRASHNGGLARHPHSGPSALPPPPPGEATRTRPPNNMIMSSMIYGVTLPKKNLALRQNRTTLLIKINPPRLRISLPLSLSLSLLPSLPPESLDPCVIVFNAERYKHVVIL